MTVSSIVRLIARPPPKARPIPPLALLPWPSPLEPKPPPLSPACPELGRPPLDGLSKPQPPPPADSSSAIGVAIGSSVCVVKALVVLEVSPRPFRIGLAAVGLDDGVASLITLWVWPLCIAGLAHGSSSMFSSESFLRRRDLAGELPGVVWFACALDSYC